MLRHLGYMGSTRSIDARTDRACRPQQAGPDVILAVIRDNLRDLELILRSNAERGIAFYRISSQIIPSAAHPPGKVAWWDEFAAEFERIGAFVRDHGLRLEMHPGQRSLFNAPSPETIALSILELGWHVRFLDALQVGASHKLAIRVGGTFGDKARSLDRFVSVIRGLPESWRSRLVIENDEVQFGVADVLEASGRTGLPVVLACFRHRPRPDFRRDDSRSVLRCFETWKPIDGPPIVHLGSPSERRGGSILRAEWVDPSDLASLVTLAPEGMPFDCLLEADQGDRALFNLRDRSTIREHGALPSVAATPID